MISGKNLDTIKKVAEEIALLSQNEFSELLETYVKAEEYDEAENLFYWRCATDLELFAVAYFPHYCTYPFNEFHRDMFTRIKFMERAVRRCRAAPRGFGKSTIAALIKPIHNACYGTEDFIVFISNRQDQANGKLRDIRAEILTNVALITDYGIHFSRKNVGETQYTVSCDGHQTMFAAYGANTEIRGIRFGAKRPSSIVVDDSEHSEEVHNESIRDKYEQWYYQVVSQIGDQKTNIEFVGTMLHRESLLAKLLKNPAYESQTYKAVISWSQRQDLWDRWTSIYTDLDNPDRLAESEAYYTHHEKDMMKGVKVLWPERESYLYLMKELIEKGKRNFLKEKQNEPLSSTETLFDQFHYYREVPEGLLIEKSGAIIPWAHVKEHAFGCLDPATGQTKARPGRRGDFACILSGFKDPKGRLLVHHDLTQRISPTKQIEKIFEQHEHMQYQKFGIETNLYRNLLLPNVVAERTRREKETKKIIKLPFYDIEAVDKKEKRIYTLEPKVSHGYILFNRALSQEFMGQMEAYPHVDHDDCPDTLEMLWGMVNNRYKPSPISISPLSGH